MKQTTFDPIRRQMYEHDKLCGVISPYGPKLYACLTEMLAIAEKYENRDGMTDARNLLAEILVKLNEEAGVYA
jgi:hypothetical protein